MANKKRAAKTAIANVRFPNTASKEHRANVPKAAPHLKKMTGSKPRPASKIYKRGA